jgi:glycosyltransferase involved in cell wall biosynthesis
MISVVIPCFGYGHFLPDAVHSLVSGPTCLGEMPGQSFADFEAVIVDDASHDETPQVASELSRRHDRVRYIRMTGNTGTAGALNAGVRASAREYVAVLSADDMFEPWHLEQFVSTLKANPGSVVYNDLRAFMGDRRLRVYRLPEYDFDDLLYKAGFGAAVMYERSSWERAGGYPEVMRYGREDWAFGIALGQVGVCGVKADGPAGYLYRQGEHNRTKRNKTLEWRERFRQQLRDLFPHLYRGERPEMCCGDRRKTPKKKNPAKRNNPAPLPGRGGMVLLEYIGRNTGAETYFTPAGNRYKFGKTDRHRTKYVARGDVKYLLGLSDGRKKLFRRYKPKPKLALTQKQIEKVNPGTTKKVAVSAKKAEQKKVEPPPEVKPVAIDATAAARKLAVEKGLGLADITGTGKDGRITLADVRKAA